MLGRLFRRRPPAALSAELWQQLVPELPFVASLPEADQARLREMSAQFLADKQIEPAGGIQVDEAMRLLIAVQACTLVLNLGLSWYRDWVSVIVYPAEFLPEYEYEDEAGVVHHVREPRIGESWLQGPVILSWEDAATRGDGVNVVLHEFAHKLDMINGEADGFPPLHPGMQRAAWTRAFTRAYEDFSARVEAGQRTGIDPYAAESPGEFFAVFTEAFFELPQRVQRDYPEVYAQLAAFYRQDPAARLAQ